MVQLPLNPCLIGPRTKIAECRLDSCNSDYYIIEEILLVVLLMRFSSCLICNVLFTAGIVA